MKKVRADTKLYLNLDILNFASTVFGTDGKLRPKAFHRYRLEVPGIRMKKVRAVEKSYPNLNLLNFSSTVFLPAHYSIY